MAKAYLGKISAIVTANTSDFNSKLSASAKEVRTFAAAMQSTLSRAESGAAASLRSIYTEAQKTERALKAAASLRLSFKGIDTSKFKDIGEAADQFRRVTSAAEQIYKPLAQAAKATESLSNEVRGEFQPALIAAQRQAELMNTALTSGLAVSEKSFARVQRRAEETAQAVRRLTEASQAVGGLATGRELRFQSPAFAKALQDAKNLQQRADTIDPSRGAQLGLGSAIENQRIAAARAERANARLEATRLRPDTDPTKGGRLAAAEQNASAATASFNEANAALQRIVSSEEEAALAAGKLATSASAADAAAKSLAASFERLRASANQALTGVPQTVSQARQEFDSLLSQVGRLTAAGRGAAAPLTNELISLFEAAANGDENIDAVIAKLKELKFVVADVGDVNAGSIGLSSQNFPGNTQGNPTGPQSPPLPPGFGGQSDAGLGATLGDSSRQITLLRSGIVSLKSQLDTMPASVRSQFIPALKDAESEFLRLAAIGPGAVSTEIDKAARKLDGLTQRAARAGRGQNFSEQFGGRGTRGLELNLQDVSLRGYTAQLQILQQTLSKVSSAARGPALTSFNELRKAIANAAKNGTLDLASTRQELARLTTNAVNAAAAVGSISPGRLAGQLKRAGDIGRGAFGNLGLGIQQATFAFDDFFSVTGGLDQRIRAAGNNISQLGFVLGGTTGLITGVAVSITAQLVVALIKWQNAGVGVEDRLKSLNDALSRQKSLVEDLAGAFRAIADEIANIGFSKPGADAAKFQQQLDDIRQKQKEFNQERFAELDPDVQRERGIVASREARLAKEEDPAVRLRLQGEINNARRREAEAAQRARGAAPITAAEAARVAVESRRAREVQIAREIESPNEEAGANNRARQRQKDIDRRLGGASSESERQEIARDQLLFERARLTREAESNDFFGADLLVGGSSNSEQVTAVEIAIRQLDQAIVDSANRLEVETASAAIGAAKQIGLAQAKVADAIEAGVPGAVGLQVQLDGLTQQLFDAQSELAAAQKRAREGGTGADLDAATKAREEVARIQDSINQRDGEIRAIEASRRALELFTTAFEKVRQEAESNLQAAESARDQARGDNLEQGTAGSRQRLDRAERDVNRQNEARNRVRQEVARAEEAARQDEGVRRREEEIARIDGQLSSSVVLAPGQRDGLIARREELRQQNESAVRDTVNNDAGVQAARDASTAEERRRQAAERGRQAAQTPAQKAGEELAGTLRDIRTNFEAQPGGAALAADASRRAAQEAMRQTAPAIFGMADQVQNAVLQGPSRAALQASDVTTMQGASELNRLIRGDDSAKNVDTVELQKQSKALERLVQIAEENGAPPGVFN